MAMVLDAFASYLQGMLTEMAAEEIHLLLGVSVEIDKMGNKLKDLKKLLADADRRNITDESVQGWVTELRRAMYDATDILDLCQLKVMERGESTVDAGCCNPFLFCIRNPFHAHDIGSRIKKLNERLDDIKQRSVVFKFIDLGTSEDRGRNMHASHHSNTDRETSGGLDPSGVVGEKIEEDTRALVTRILQTGEGENKNIMVVAIVGVGGIGKTTLAQNVFNHESIQSEFDKKIWLSVNKNFDKAKLLRTAITLAGGEVSYDQEALAVLQPILTEALKGKKVLLVMDDLWSHGAWEGLLKIPLVNAAASGSRVLMTTRDETVARGMTATWPHHHIDKLSLDDAWSLLKKQVLSSETDEYQLNMLKDVGLKIIQKCGGLPLAVKVMGGLLRRREMQRRDWEQVLDDSKWSMNKMPEVINNAVYLSYEDMPPDLKQCFLYYSLLPKSINFFDDLHVIGMWIGEGFIHGNSGDLEELGQKYYNELISRNLIELDELNYGQKFCSMHDVVRSFGQYMAREEALAAHNGEIDVLEKLYSRKFLRLSIETDEEQSGDFYWKSLQEQQSMRTLISNVEIKMKPGDSFGTSPSLRTLYINSADVALVESLHQLKHLRYLKLVNSGISALPGDIGKMIFLQYLDLLQCINLVNLPDGIVKLGQLRYLNLPDKFSMIPRGFHGLKNMRILGGFPALVNGDWCSLDELGPLSQLRFLRLVQLENASSAANARISEKKHLINLLLHCTPRQEQNEDEQQRIEKVFNQLCPPSSIENIDIYGYFGQELPSWMMSTPTVPLDNLKFLLLSGLACCTQLPDGLCHLPFLQVLEVDGAPCIKRVGTEFLHTSQATAVPFPRLQKMELKGMTELEEWEWEEKVQAMPRLEDLFLWNCKLGRVPPGLASNARALRKISIKRVKQLSYFENFPFVVELTVFYCPDLERITNLPKVQKLTITSCPKLKLVKDVPVLEMVVLEDYTMEELPEYAQVIKARHLQIFCRLWLLASAFRGDSGLQLDKFSQVEYVKAYAAEGDNKRKWYVLYARDKCKLESNISSSKVLEETLSSSMVDTQGFEHIYKMKRSTFDYVCNLVRVPILEDMMATDHTFVDGRVLSLQDRVAVALKMLNSGEPSETVGSSVGVNESIVSLVTKSFADAMWEKAIHHILWPDFSGIEKIKYKFDKIHGLPNCCGVVHTDHITFGSRTCDHEVNDSMLMQAVVDTDMRFTDIWLGSSGSMNQSGILHDSALFKYCEKGTWLNGSKLNLSDGRQVGEYVIGDAGFPFLPWLLTSYQEDDLSDCRVEFNRRHSKAMTVTRTKAIAKLKDTWKFLHGVAWRPENRLEPSLVIYACCMLHNIVIDKESDAAMGSYKRVNYGQQVRQLADEDPVMARDILSQHLTSKPLESGGTLAIFEDAQMLESLLKMPRRTFDYLCSLLKESSLEIMNNYFFFDMRLFSLEDRVAIALIMLNSGDPPATVGSYIGVNQATVSLVTQTFVEVMWERAIKHLCWPDSTEIEKIKYKFDKIHGLPNCCGIVHTVHIRFGSHNKDHEVNDDMLMQAVVDTDMRFTDTWLAWPDSMNQSSLLHESELLTECEKGTWLNGSKLNLPDGLQLGEYIIGDAGYPLLPWLLTPYQLENELSDSQLEFNRRHSEATTISLRAVERLKDTWKFLHGGAWRLENHRRAIYACFMLHNIVIHMECKAGTLSYHGMNRSQQVRRLADEDAVVARDLLLQHLTRKPLESGGRLAILEDAQRLESVLKMPRRTFDYVCSLLKESSLDIMNSYFFFDMRFFSLEDRVAIALIMLNSGNPPATVGSSIGVNEATVSLITWTFADVMWQRASHNVCWPDSSEIEKIKYKFDKIYGLPNCCGVVHTAHLTFGSQSCDHEENDGKIIQAVIDTDMRLAFIWMGSPDNMNQSSLLHDSRLFKECEKGTWLNGNKLNLSDGFQVGEYIVGDAGFPLLPWLLTPYQERNLSDGQVEFNRRHSKCMAIVPRALARLKETWKFLHRGAWRPKERLELSRAIQACCILHNIVIDMECKAGPESDRRMNRMQQVRQLADEDVVAARDMLSQHLTRKPLESGGTLTIFEDAQRLESVLKMPRRTFDYVCSLMKESSLEIMNNYFFFDMRFFSLEERVAIALIMLNSGDPPATVGTFIGVNESTVSLVTKSFADAMLERAQHHVRWPQSDEMEKMKSKFDKIHGLPNCCGVLHTTLVTSASRSWDHQDKDSFVLQGVIAPDMRFTSIEVAPRPGNTSQSSFLRDSDLFESCEEGAWLNGSKLKVSSEEVGEYVIGDVGYPLLPWLLTPYYQLQNDLSDIPSYQAEFNSRHSAAKNIALKALARLEGTWKFMHGEWRPDTGREMSRAIHVCCILHNIVIDIEEDAGMPSDQEEDDSKQKRQLADEDAVRARDVLSEYMTSRSSESRVDEVDQEVQQTAAPSGSG